MPRLIILLLTLASLTILTVQNLGAEKAVPLVVLGEPIATIPLGLLLLAAVGVGALMTLVLYGLVGVRRSQTSKYKPMGSRVPSPDDRTSPTPGSAPAPATSTTGPQYGRESGSSAFVAPAPVDRADTSAAGTFSAGSSSSNPSPADPQSGSFVSPPVDSPVGSPEASSSSTASNIYSPFSRSESSGNPTSQAAADEKKKPSRRVESPNPNSRVNDDRTRYRAGEEWGERRTAVQRNSWDVGEDSSASRYDEPRYDESAGQGGLFGLVKGLGTGLGIGSALGTSRDAAQINEEIESGWQEPATYDARYAREGDGGFVDEHPDDERLDRGWERFDDSRDDYQQNYQRKVYGDDLYGVEEPAYDREPFDEETEELDSDHVYEADYRVIVPPSRSLEEDETY